VILIHGTRLYGKVDQVPGLFYVATQFLYVQFVPLIPLGSYLVMDQARRRKGFSGCKIGLSGKSVLFAWGRLALLLCGAAGVIAGIVEVVEGLDKAPHRLLDSLVPLGFAAVVFILLYCSYRFAHAGPERALRLAEKAGIPLEVIVEHFAPDEPEEDLEEVLPAEAES